MILITKQQRHQLITNGIMNYSREMRGLGHRDFFPVVKLFSLTATWLISEIDPFDHDVFFCLADCGVGCPEMGSESFRSINAVRIERDKYFRAKKPLSAYAADARAAGMIVT